MGNLIKTGKEITKNDIKQALKLDKMVYKEEYYLTEEMCYSYYNANNEIYIMIINDLTDEIIGYMNYVPINDEFYEKIRTGLYIDTILKAKDILKYEKNNEYNIYLSSIVINPSYQNMGYSKLLLNALKEKIEKLYKQQIYYKRIIADVVSNEGKHICDQLKIKFVKNTNHFSKIYETNLTTAKLSTLQFIQNLEKYTNN